jgi:rSAM/selenodomain-associated transferase 1
VIVVAKAPLPGQVKTRLCPPCSPGQAADLAAAALADTLDAVARVSARRHVLALEGDLEVRPRVGFEMIPQRGGGLDERLAAAFEDVGGPALLIGMDTPQVTPALLGDAAAQLLRPDTDAVLGPAADGGWWAIGLRRPDPEVFVGVTMSRATTGLEQRQRLEDRHLRVRSLAPLQDVDDIASARSVATVAPWSRFAARLRDLDLTAGPP